MRLGGEEELEGARLSGVARWQIEVEDGRLGSVDSSEVLSHQGRGGHER